MKNKEIVWIDWAKSIGILIVVLCHTPQYNTFEKAFLFSLQMPLFFFLSGYLYSVPPPPFKNTLKKYWVTLVIPYFLFQFIFYPYWLIVQKADGHAFNSYRLYIEPFLNCLIEVPINGVTWFIVALLLIKLYAYFILRLKRKWFWTILSCLIVGIAYHVMYMDNNSLKISFAIDSMMHFWPFFFLGYYFKKTRKIEFLASGNLWLYTTLIVSFIITFMGVIQRDTSSISQEALHYILGFSGSMIVISFCIILDKLPNSFIRTISSGTIIIFGLHWMFIGTINFITKKHLGLIGEIQYTTPIAISIAVFIVFLNYFIIIFCKKHFQALSGYRK